MSKYMKSEPKSVVPKHKHCVVCNTPITMDRMYCGLSCEDEFKRTERRRKYTFILILLTFPILFFLLTLFRH